MKTISNPTLSEELAQRKGAHIDLAARAQTLASEVDSRFDYEPLFFSHPQTEEKWESEFLKFRLDYPIWVSSMTGGTGHAKTINQNLARLCGEFKLGMGLGSCRSLLHGDERLGDFKLRPLLGEQPLFANLGVAQVETLLTEGKIDRIHDLVKRLEADGLIIHLNPLQEWFQPEGDRYLVSPLETLQRFLEKASYPVLVKEVGQGLGPRSLKALLELPLAGIEFGAFGGTNFSLLESLRGEEKRARAPFINVGHTAAQMVETLNRLPRNGKEIIISGGVRSVLDGYELLSRLQGRALLGMAQAFLGPALEGEERLREFFLDLREGLLTARKLLMIKGEL